MGDIVSIYESLGIYGSVACMFLFLVWSMNRRATDQASSIEKLKIENEGQSKHIEEILKETEESKTITIRLIDRWNSSDSVRDRRHEKILESLDDLSNSVAYLQGKSNGHK